mgnify:CR=1 FL=1
MILRDLDKPRETNVLIRGDFLRKGDVVPAAAPAFLPCLLYTSDAADERSSVDLGGRRIIKKKKHDVLQWRDVTIEKKDTTELWDKMSSHRNAQQHYITQQQQRKQVQNNKKGRADVGR